MKKSFMLLLAGILTSLFIFVNEAGAYGPFTNQPVDKKWTISFSQPVDAESAKAHIYIAEDEAGQNRLDTELAIQKSSVEVLPPAGGYEPGRTYYLIVDSGLKSSGLTPIKGNVKTAFTIRTPDNSPYAARVAEIESKWTQLQPAFTGNPYKTAPSTVSPYKSGSLNPAYLTDALNITNFIRTLAYLPDDVALNASFSDEAQAASVLMGANNELTHYPKQPSDMDLSFYEKGAGGAGTSNIGYGYSDVISSIRHGYMSDADPGNIDRIGHRRWVLSPKLKEVGFGFAENKNGTPYTAMKVIAPEMYNNEEPAYEYVAWPSKTAFPASFFPGEDPWSISLNADIYDSSRLDEVTVELINATDGTTWTFSKQQQSDGYFNIDTANYGFVPYTIIFRPDDVSSYKPGETYKVNVSGVYTLTGEKTTISYETTFFKLTDDDNSSYLFE